MAFPNVNGRNNNASGSASTTHTVNLPTSITAGELLLIVMGFDGNPTSLSASGWTFLTIQGVDSIHPYIGVGYKTATGSEGSSVSVTLGSSRKGAYVSSRISDWNGAPEQSSITTASFNPDPPSITPSGGSLDYLFIAVGSLINSGALPFISAAPANYSNLTGGSTVAGGAGNKVGVATAERQLNASSEDPGAFTSQSINCAAIVIAISPVVAVGGGPGGSFLPFF